MAKKTGAARSQRELAKRVGRDPAAVNRWLKDDRWPFSRTPPWDVAKVKAWADRTLAENPAERPKPTGADAGMERRAKIIGTLERGKVAAERAKMLKLEREIKEGQWHRVDECESRLVRQVRQIAGLFRNDHPRRCGEKLARQLLPHLQGLDEGQVQRIVEGVVQDDASVILEYLAGNRPSPYPDPAPAPTPRITKA